VAYCIDQGKDLPELTIEEWQTFSPAFETDIFAAITLEASVNARSATGGTARAQVLAAIARAQEGR
jgi:argininosuccinate lyase